MLAVGAHVFFDLHDQFAGGREHKHTRAASLSGGGRQLGQDRQRESRRLAGAGLGNANHVLPREDQGNGR